MTTGSIRGVVQRAACFTTATNVVPRVPRHRTRQYLYTFASSAVPLPNREPLVLQNGSSWSNVETAIEEDIAATDGARGIGPSEWKPPTLDWTVPRDFLVRAKTGAGKTFPYIIPAVESRLNYKHRAGSAGPLILAPTRELAIQIAGEIQRLTAHHKGFEVQLLAGATHKARQEKDWVESSRDIVVATPGRLRDLLTNEPGFRQGFKGCPMLILDEADTLLSMGFRDDIDAIVSFLPPYPHRRTFLFSATMLRAVRQLASWILSPDHIFIDATPPEPRSTPCGNEEYVAHMRLAAPYDAEFTTRDHIEQFRTLCPTASDQLPTLLKLLAHDQLTNGTSSKVIVFCPTVQIAELLSMLLRSLAEEVLPGNHAEIMTMHLKMKQSARDRTRVLFHRAGKTQSGRPTVLVTSDFSARSVGYPGLTRIIQIGIPSREAMYVHRMRRMARGIKNNKLVVRADLLLLPWEAGYMDWKLTSLPIKSLPISVLDDQLASLSSQSPALTTEFLKSTLAGVQQRIDPADVRSAAASLLGYYLPLTPSLRLQPHAVLAGVSSWASECFHVSIPTITRLPKKFTDAYEQSTRLEKTKGLFVDGLRLAGPSPLGKAKSKNRSVWEGANTRRKKPKRWY